MLTLHFRLPNKSARTKPPPELQVANVTGDSASVKTRTARKAEDSDDGNDLSRQLFKQDDGGIAIDDDQKVLNDSNVNKSAVGGESRFRKQQSILKN